MPVDIYGIPNCDTVKKARKWLDANGVGYTFHDYKKEGVDTARLESWVAEKGWEVLLNKRGTTFRKLSDAEKADIDTAKAIGIMAEHTSTIKRPVVEHAGNILVGFKPDEWEATLG